MKSYFLLRNPHFTLRLIQVAAVVARVAEPVVLLRVQMLVLLQSFFLSLYVLVFAHRINNEFNGISVLAMHLVVRPLANACFFISCSLFHRFADAGAPTDHDFRDPAQPATAVFDLGTR